MQERALPPTTVAKTLCPPKPGTVKLARRYGTALVCVRYRHDASGLHRYTTVEIVVDDAPISNPRLDRKLFGVEIAYREDELRARVKAHGAKWDKEAKVWRLTGATVKRLGLNARVRTGNAK